jgi:hypothetical protein
MGRVTPNEYNNLNNNNNKIKLSIRKVKDITDIYVGRQKTCLFVCFTRHAIY